MTSPNGTAAGKPAIEVSLTVTLAMTPEQVGAYAREYHIDADQWFTPPVARDIFGRLQETAQAALEGEYLISSFTTVDVSEPRLHVRVII